MRVSNSIFVICSALILSTTILADTQKPSYSEALDAYEQYWSTFEAYDNRKLKDTRDKYQKKWASLKAEFDQKLIKKSQEKLTQLQESAKNYRTQLEEHPNSKNRPYVLLNLAQVYSLMAQSQDRNESDKGNNSIYSGYALNVIGEIESSYPNFTHIENAVYLKATILDKLQRDEEALQSWSKLAIIAKDTKYGLYGVIGMGDYYFAKDEPKSALQYFKKASNLLKTLELDNEVYESLRVNYRIAWASYRTADLDDSIAAATGLLRLRYRIRDPDRQKKVFEDAVELTGDALYEKNDLIASREVLKRKDIRLFADSIGDRILKRFDTNNIHSGTIEIGGFLLQEFPLSIHIPDWYLITSRAYDELGQEKYKIDALERLAMLLPKNSLWQNKHRHEYDVTEKMKKNASDAARIVAAYYYDLGKATANPGRFLTAASYYGILAERLPNHDESNHWRLRKAHCYYFADKLDRAAEQYRYLIGQIELTDGQLEIAMYQLALTSERNWRQQFAQSTEYTNDLEQGALTKKALSRFAEDTESFANRFPDNRRSVDLLLLVAAAYRDSDDHDQARLFWKRALLSSPSVSQRLIAIRGLIYAEVQLGNNSEVANLTERFLQLEDWNQVDRNFRIELLGTLSSAVLNYSKELSRASRQADAGRILVDKADQFPEIPDRERLYRDGAYMLAIGDDWRAAQQAAESYLRAGLKAYRDDMIYLRARAYEFRLDFNAAAKQYIKLADDYPAHKKSISGLKRAERLASSEKDWMLAAQSATLLARIGAPKNRSDAMKRAVDYYNRADRHDLAKKASQHQLRMAPNKRTKFEARLSHARAQLLDNETADATKELKSLSDELKRRPYYKNEQYADISGEVNFLLGQDIQAQFTDFELRERAGSLTKNVAFKMKIFEKMVKYYELAIQSGSPEWGARSRFTLGAIAGEFADEIARSTASRRKNLDAKASNKLKQTVRRLNQIKTSYHSQNVLARTKDPELYRDNQWIEKSHSQLNYGDNAYDAESGSEDNLPLAIFSDLSNIWSH